MGAVYEVYRRARQMWPMMLELAQRGGSANESDLIEAIWKNEEESHSEEAPPRRGHIEEEIAWALAGALEMGWLEKGTDDSIVSVTEKGSRRFSPKTEGPKRHHYLAEMYLKRFVGTDGNVAVFDRENGETRRQGTVNTGVISHLYTIEDHDGRRRFELELGLAEGEGVADVIITKILNKEAITQDERISLAMFIGTMASRTPAAIETVKRQMDEFTAWIGQTLVDRGKMQHEYEKELRKQGKTDEEIEETWELLKGAEFLVTTDEMFSMNLSLETAVAISDVLYARRWEVVEISDKRKSFITNDAPVMVGVSSREANRERLPIGYASEYAHIWFPISQKAGLWMEGWAGDLCYRPVGEGWVRNINLPDYHSS